MAPSLCESCENVREVRTARSLFLLCALHTTSAGFPKYPPQPVVRCAGYRRSDEVRPDAPDPKRPGAGPSAPE